MLKSCLVALSAAACMLSVGGCTPSPGPNASSELMASAPASAGEKTESLALTPYSEPPKEPPSASLKGQRLKPSQVVWRIDGHMQSIAPKSDSDVVINGVSPENWRSPVVVLSTANAPLRARLVTYRLPRPGGLPSSDDGHAVDCEKRGQSCRLEMSGDSFSVVSGITMDPLTMATLTLEYPTLAPEDVRSGVRSYFVSWVLRAVAPPAPE